MCRDAESSASLSFSATAFAAVAAERGSRCLDVAAANVGDAELRRRQDAAADVERAAAVMTALVVDDGPSGSVGVPSEFRGWTSAQVKRLADEQEAQRAASAARLAAAAEAASLEAMDDAVLRRARERAARDLEERKGEAARQAAAELLLQREQQRAAAAAEKAVRCSTPCRLGQTHLSLFADRALFAGALGAWRNGIQSRRARDRLYPVNEKDDDDRTTHAWVAPPVSADGAGVMAAAPHPSLTPCPHSQAPNLTCLTTTTACTAGSRLRL